MKTLRVSPWFVSLTCRALVAGVIALILVRLPASATTFTNDTTINANDTNYEGEDIIVTNCTVMVDGPHAFSSLLVAAGGVLTHSFSPDGVISNLLSVVDESQTLNGTNPVTLLNSNVITASVLVTDSGSTTIYTNGVDYLLTSPDGIMTQLQRTTNSTIPDGANVLVSYDALLGVLPAGFNLSVTGNVEVAVGGAINANGKGYGGGAGPGAGYAAGSPADGSGAGYGGIGGMSSSNAMGGTTYGSFTQPTDLGSGGGTSYAGIGGAGGGAVQISAGGTFIVNGTISADGANGTNSRSGGGSGGSIWITAQLVSGSGAISAQGGAGEPTHGGGGGGGRIAIQSDVNSFAGSLAANGGAGAMTGGAGTVYTELTGQNGLLVFDNAGHAGTNSLVAISSSSIDVLIRGNAAVIPSGAWTIGNLTIASNGLLLASSALSPINLTASGNVTIQEGGSLLADNAGYSAGAGIGYGLSYNDGSYRPCGGGGYGGRGANGASANAGGGTTYGSQTSPTTYGSGGGQLMPYSSGGAGGGAIQLNVSGTLQVDGRISANGGSGSGSGGGGGAGGSLWLTTGVLIGSGSITANGGNGAEHDRRRRRGRSHCHLSRSEPVRRNDFRLWQRRGQLGRSGNRLPPAHRTEWPAHSGQRRKRRNQHPCAIRKFRRFDFTQRSDWVGIQLGELCQFAHEFQRLAHRLPLLRQRPCLHREFLIFGKRHHSGRRRHFHGRLGLSRGSGTRRGTILLQQFHLSMWRCRSRRLWCKQHR